MFSGEISEFVRGLRASRALDVSVLAFEALPTSSLEETTNDLTHLIRRLEAARIAAVGVLDERRTDPMPPADNTAPPEPDPDDEPAAPPPPPPTPTDPKADHRARRLARALSSLPHTRRAFETGRLSIDQASRLATLASDRELGDRFRAGEAGLVDAVATASPDTAGRIIREWRARAGSTKRDARARHRRRAARTWVDPDGFTHLHFEAADGHGANVGALFRTMLDADWTRRATKSGDGPIDERTRNQRAADVLRWSLELAVASLSAGQLLPRPRTSMLVGVDYRDLIDAVGATELQTGAPVNGEDIRKLCCDAGIARIVTDGPSVPLDKGRETRLATVHQRQVLASIHSTCVMPTCSVPFAWSQIHHVDEFSKGLGETNIDDLVPACSVHHDDLHHGGHRIERDDATGLRWVTADGAHHPIRPKPPNAIPRPMPPPETNSRQLGLAV